MTDQADRDAFLEVAHSLADEHDHDIQAVFDDPRFQALFEQYGAKQCIEWAHLALVRGHREETLAGRITRFYERIVERAQGLPEDTRIGDIMDDQEIDRIVMECGLGYADDGTFVLLEDNA